MGSEQSSQHEQRNSRNVSQAQVDKALERQRQMYEQRMEDLLRRQAASRNTPQNTAGQTGQLATRVPPQRPVAPPRCTIDASNLERQPNPYSYTQNNLTGAVQPTTAQLPSSPQTLYPNLDNRNSPLFPGNNYHTTHQSPVTGTNNNDFVIVNSNFHVAPSAPPESVSLPSQQRSVSRPRNSGTENENGINCPTCRNRFGLRIFNCSNGHASCMNCRTQQRLCGLCNSMITQMRNISVEEYVSQFKVPCVNADEGCTLHFKMGEMDSHVKECPFREIQCLLPSGLCRWKGKLSLLGMHFDNFHPSHKGDVDTEMSLEMHNMYDSKRMQFIKIGNFNFLVHLIVSESDNKIYIAVQLLGTKTSAMKWTYEIHVYNKGEPRRKYQYADKCVSNTETLTDLLKENRCAVLPLQYAKTFINHGAINYRFFIKREFAQAEHNRDVSSTRRGGRGGRGRGGFHKC